MATLVAAALENGSPAARAHAGAEAVLSFATAHVWLIRTFHEKTPRTGSER